MVMSFVTGDWCRALVVDEPFLSRVTEEIPVAVFGSVARLSVVLFAGLEPVCLDRAIRPRFRSSRVNSHCTWLRRHREQGNARSHRTRRAWHESQAMRLRLQRFLAVLFRASFVLVSGGVSGCWPPDWVGSISGQHWQAFRGLGFQGCATTTHAAKTKSSTDVRCHESLRLWRILRKSGDGEICPLCSRTQKNRKIKAKIKTKISLNFKKPRL